MTFAPTATQPGHHRDSAPPETLGGVLRHMQAVLADQAGADRVALAVMVGAMQKRSFPVLLLLPALLLVSPLSAIPGATTVFGLTIAALLAQYLLGRSQIWLPQFILRKSFHAARLERAIDWLHRPVGRLEILLRPRMGWVFSRPLALVPVVLVLAAALCAPLMEVIPGSGTSVGAAICMFCAGLLARDGVFVVLGAGLAAALPITLWALLN
jgi:hypothetical protein